jgi:hypothetical protein
MTSYPPTWGDDAVGYALALRLLCSLKLHKHCVELGEQVLRPFYRLLAFFNLLEQLLAFLPDPFDQGF